MTAKKSSRKTNIVTARYIGYKLKHSWTVMLMCFITLFFIMNVPFLISSEELELAKARDILLGTDNFAAKAEGFFVGDTVALIFVGCCLAVAIGCYSLSYMNNKTAAGFFHSLPEKRSGHFIASLITAIADFVIPFTANILILTVITAAKGMLYKFIGILILKMLFIVILSYLSILAVCYVAGMLTGTTAIHVIFTLYLIFILPALEFFCLNWIETDFFLVNAWNILANHGNLISPAFRIVGVGNLLFTESSYFAVSSLVIELILIPAELIIAFVLYKKRSIEVVGTPIIYRKLSDIVKYSAIFLMSLIGALFFRSIGDGISWTIFGFCSGAVLTFMIMNTILNRTSKLMFKGLKGLCVCAVVTAALIAVAQTGFFGILDYVVPTAENIHIRIDGNNYELTDKDEINEFRNIMKEFNSALQNDRDSVILDRSTVISESSSEDYYEVYEKMEWELAYSVRCENFEIEYTDKFENTTTYTYNNVYVTSLTDIVKFLNKGSISNALSKENIYDMSVNLSLSVLKDDILSLVESNDELTEEMAFIAGNFSSCDMEYCTVDIDLSCNLSSFPKENQDTVKEQGYKIYKYIEENGFNVENKQSIGRIYMYNYDYISTNSVSLNAPIYLEDVKILRDLLFENEIFDGTDISIQIGNKYANFNDSKLVYYLFDCFSADYIQQVSESVDYILLYDSTTGKIQKIINRNKIESLMNDSAQILSVSTLSFFTQTNNRYVMYVATNDEYTNGYITYLLKK